MKQNGRKNSDFIYLNVGKKDCLVVFSNYKVRLLKRLMELVDKGDNLVWVATVNPEFVIEAKKDEKFYKILQKTTLNTTDGIGIVWEGEISKVNGRFNRIVRALKVGIKILTGQYRNRISSGSELMVDLSKQAVERKWKVFFLGGFGDSAKATGEKIDDLVGGGLKYEVCQGRPDYSDAQVFISIYKFKPDILFVAYGMKKQEEWIYEHRSELKKAGVRLVIGVGRSFDYYSGKLAMPPMWIKRMGLEWLYALINDPKRWKRDLKLIEFVWGVIKG